MIYLDLILVVALSIAFVRSTPLFVDAVGIIVMLGVCYALGMALAEMMLPLSGATLFTLASVTGVFGLIRRAKRLG